MLGIRERSSSLILQPRTTLSSIKPTSQHTHLRYQCYSSSQNTQKTESSENIVSKDAATAESKMKQRLKTQAEVDEELRLKMSGIAGDGGDSGVEYEDGQPVSMKRSVKNNMFRYI
ncbi:hypothetical protein M501DRAFT_1013581 [Patellaria atrata CBS 101060]|uniref:Uncharacterized protein n=1 Tax=Patellaria atrata CBS 101060 TaxID=1346257 RepID=A0A9P4SI39_9PEZI|nr:hypothetical protein M501DRAFT_1013581 [Patellaria atrata CBS 101060]